MHMLVLYGNTGCKMDLSTSGYTVAVIREMLPACAYTPCIEEHNIHAIFRWPSIWTIFEAFLNKTGELNRGVELQDVDADMDFASKQASTVEFLKETGLTLSITTLGTCIYRFGKKRNREAYNTGAQELMTSTSQTDYSVETERSIFKICKHIHQIVTTS